MHDIDRDMEVAWNIVCDEGVLKVDCHLLQFENQFVQSDGLATIRLQSGYDNISVGFL